MPEIIFFYAFEHNGEAFLRSDRGDNSSFFKRRDQISSFTLRPFSGAKSNRTVFSTEGDFIAINVDIAAGNLFENSLGNLFRDALGNLFPDSTTRNREQQNQAQQDDHNFLQFNPFPSPDRMGKLLKHPVTDKLYQAPVT